MAGCVLYDEDFDFEMSSNYSGMSEKDIQEQIRGYHSKYRKYLVKKKTPAYDRCNKVNADDDEDLKNFERQKDGICLNSSDAGFHDDDDLSISSSVLNSSYANIFENRDSFMCSSEIFDVNTAFKKPKPRVFTQIDNFNNFKTRPVNLEENKKIKTDIKRRSTGYNCKIKSNYNKYRNLSTCKENFMKSASPKPQRVFSKIQSNNRQNEEVKSTSLSKKLGNSPIFKVNLKKTPSPKQKSVRKNNSSYNNTQLKSRMKNSELKSTSLSKKSGNSPIFKVNPKKLTNPEIQSVHKNNTKLKSPLKKSELKSTTLSKKLKDSSTYSIFDQKSPPKLNEIVRQNHGVNKNNSNKTKTPFGLSEKSKIIKRDDSAISKMLYKTDRILESLSQSINVNDTATSSLVVLLNDVKFELRNINKSFSSTASKKSNKRVPSTQSSNDYSSQKSFQNNKSYKRISSDNLLKSQSSHLSQKSSVDSPIENYCDLYFPNKNLQLESNASFQTHQDSPTYSLSDLILTNSQEYIEKLSSTFSSQDFNEGSVVLTDAFENTEDLIRNTQFKEIRETVVPDIQVEVDFINNHSSSPVINRNSLLSEALLKMAQNPDLQFKERKKAPWPSKAEVLARIRKVFTGLQDDLRNGKKLGIRLDRYKDWRNVVFEDDVLSCKKGGLIMTIRKMQEGKRGCCSFKLVVYILLKIYTLLMTGATCTKREIYYQIMSYINKQQQVNAMYDVVCCLLDTPPWVLGIMPSGHGLVYGNITLTINQTTINCNIKGGILIPQDVKDIRRIETDARFVLIVEKDSIFQKMLDEDIPNKLSKPFILITGKGYPDTNTRFFAKKLSIHLKLPMFILVDADPFGIEIMLSYRFGTLNTSFLSRELAMPNLRWIGVHPSEIRLLNIKNFPLSEFDKRKIEHILKRPYMDSYPKIRLQLNLLKKRNFKAEIEGLIKCNQSLGNFYIPNKLCTQDFI